VSAEEEEPARREESKARRRRECERGNSEDEDDAVGGSAWRSGGKLKGGITLKKLDDCYLDNGLKSGFWFWD